MHLRSSAPTERQKTSCVSFSAELAQLHSERNMKDLQRELIMHRKWGKKTREHFWISSKRETVKGRQTLEVTTEATGATKRHLLMINQMSSVSQRRCFYCILWAAYTTTAWTPHPPTQRMSFCTLCCNVFETLLHFVRNVISIFSVVFFCH